MSAMVLGKPNPVASAHIWNYDEALPHLQKAARLGPEEQAERRVESLHHGWRGLHSRRREEIMFRVTSVNPTR